MRREAFTEELLPALVVGVIVGLLAHWQEGFWNEIISIEPDWLVALGIGVFAAVVSYTAMRFQ